MWGLLGDEIIILEYYAAGRGEGLYVFPLDIFSMPFFVCFFFGNSFLISSKSSKLLFKILFATAFEAPPADGSTVDNGVSYSFETEKSSAMSVSSTQPPSFLLTRLATGPFLPSSTYGISIFKGNFSGTLLSSNFFCFFSMTTACFLFTARQLPIFIFSL